MPEGSLSPDEKRHEIEREGHEPNERKRQEHSPIPAAAVETGSEGRGLHHSPSYKERDEAGSHDASKQQHDIGEQSHGAGV